MKFIVKPFLADYFILDISECDIKRKRVFFVKILTMRNDYILSDGKISLEFL
jgi:hypothetical protein